MNAEPLIFSVYDSVVLSGFCGINLENKQQVICLKLKWIHFDYKTGQKELNFKQIFCCLRVFVCFDNVYIVLNYTF